MAENEVPNEQTPEVTPDPLFVVDDATKEFFETYVGPGKKYPNIGELAKGYANADRHIEELRRDTGKFKTEADSLKELLMEQLVNTPPSNNELDPNTPPNDVAPQAQPSDAAPPKEEGNQLDLKALVKEAMGEADLEKVRTANARQTEEATIKRFGSKEDAVKAIQERADELGLSPQWIANLAFESPKAYFATMGFNPDEPPKSNNSPASRSDVNPQTLEKTNQRVQPNTYQYYKELRRTDPTKWRSQEIQQAILRDASNNPNFYSN